MGDWKSFQEDFSKIFSTLGINQNVQKNDPVTATKTNEEKNEKKDAPRTVDENELKKLAAADAALVRERCSEWAEGGVWDSRAHHPVPAYPVI